MPSALTQLPALDVKVQDMEDLPERIMESKLLPLKKAAAEAELKKQTELAPIAVQQSQLELQNAQRDAKGADISAMNARLAQAARDAMAADPADAAKIWDDAMQAEVDAGNKRASQYIGHYRQDLAERVADVYGSNKVPEKAKIDPNVERAIQTAPIEQIKKAHSNLTRVIEAYRKISAPGADAKAAWDAEIEALKQAGIDPTTKLGSLEYSPLNYAAARRVIEEDIIPMRDAMAKRVTGADVGLDVKPAPQGTWTYVGSQPGTNLPVYHNNQTNEETVGKTPTGGKPSAGQQTFQTKFEAAKKLGYSDTDALEFANGRKTITPERLPAMALSLANQQLADLTLSGATIDDPEQWVKDQAEKNLKEMQGARPQPTGAAPPPALPKEAVAKLKKGVQTTFGNNQVWTLDADGKPKRLK